LLTYWLRSVHLALLRPMFLGGILLFLAHSGAVSAQVRLNLSHNQDSSTAVHKSMVYMADRVSEQTDGELIIRIYPNSQLGSQRESMELMQIGAIDMVKSNASELEAFAPAYGAFNLPYIFLDREHYYRALSSSAAQDILDSSVSRGFVGLTYYDGGSRSFYANKPINTPADLAGMKIRVQPSPTAIKMIQSMGGAPTPLAYSELYTALQQSVVDGAENSVMALTKARHGEVAKVFSRDEHTMIPDVLLISTKSLSRLNLHHRKVLIASARESMNYMKALWAQETTAAEQQALSMGVTFVDVDKQPFVDAVSGMHTDAMRNPDIASYVIAFSALSESLQ